MLHVQLDVVNTAKTQIDDWGVDNNRLEHQYDKVS